MGLFTDMARAASDKFPGGSPSPNNPTDWRQTMPAPGGSQPGTQTGQSPNTSVTVEQLQQIIGDRWDTEHLRSVLSQLQALGIEVQNQERGDLRPRFRLPNGDVWDFGPGGWQSRGQMGPGFATDGGSGNGAPSGVTPTGGAGSTGFENTPGYRFSVDEMMRGMQRSAAARGTLLTGGFQQALAQRIGGYASQHYGDLIDRYYRLLGAGR